MKMTGAQAVLENLKHEGVDVVFGYPGGAILPLYDEFYNQHFHISLRAMNKVPSTLLTDMPG